MRVSIALRDAAIYVPCYVMLDWASYIDPVGPFNITPWNPQPALGVVWMTLGGLSSYPVVMLAVLAADVIVRHAPGGWMLTLVTAAWLTTGYALVALLLRRLLRERRLRTLRDLTAFCLVAVLCTGVIGIGFLGLLRAAGELRGAPFVDVWLRFWTGDAVGLLVTAPLLLAAADAGRRAAFVALLRSPEGMLQALVLVAAVWGVFVGASDDPARLFYLLFLPMIWIAARGGMVGAIAATAFVQMAVVVAIHARPVTMPLVELQALVAALTVTALYLGVMVDERVRAEEAFRQSLRLAAAGEMAGSIAHEVSQPLAAAANYGHALELLLERDAPRDALGDVVRRMLAETARAGDIVHRLRDFFRSGTMRLETVAVAELMEAAGRVGLKAIGDRPITLSVAANERLPALVVDRLQIELVLRNLVVNAVEAVDAAQVRRKVIQVAAERDGERFVRITVRDSGPGVAVADRDRLFRPFESGKRSGMGLGLAVSRAIAEAHGGSLAYAPGEHGEFHLLLPADGPR